MAGSSFSKYLKKICGLLVIMPILFITGCGEGDGPTKILGTAATPLPPGGGGGAFDSGLLTNGDFEVGIEPWVGNAANAVDDGGNSVNFANIATAGQSFDVNLSQILTLTQGETYTLTFKARSDGNRTIIAGIGLSVDPFTSVTETVNLTEDWQTFEFELTATFGGADSRVLFDMGADTGLVLIDDVSLTAPNGGGAAGGPIDPEVVLYASAGDPDLVIPDDYAAATEIGSESVINLFYADDDTYNPVLAVSSGTGYSANVAEVAFIGFEPGFLTFYDDVIFKVKGMPNFVIFVSLYEGGERIRLNLSSSDLAGALDNGWYQVSIPLSSFTGLTTATGIVFESDDTASMQFEFYLNDIGFSEADLGDGGDGGDGGAGPGGSLVPVATILEADGSVADLTATFTGFDSGTGTAIVADSTYAQALEVTVADAYAPGALNLAQLFITELSSLDSYSEFLFKVKGLTDNNLVMKIEPPAGGPAVAINLAAPGAGITVEELSDGWTQVVVSLAQFGDLSSATLVILQTLDNAYALGDTFLLTDIGFDAPDGGAPTGGSVLDATILAADGSVADLTATFTGFDSGTGTAIVADSTYAQALEVTVADAYAPGALNLAQLFITELSSLDSYSEFLFKVKGLTDNNLVMKIEPPAGGPAVAINLAAPGAGITVEELSDGWTQVGVSLAQFGDLSSATLVILQTLDNAYALGDTFLLTDIGFSIAGSGGGDDNGGGSGDPTFVNGNFEDGLTGWTQTRVPDGVGSITADTSEQGSRAGTVARLATEGVSATQANDVLISQEGLAAGTVAPGDSIDVSFDLYGSLAGAGGVVFVEVIFLNANGEDQGGRNFVGPAAPYVPTTTWTTHSGSVIAGTGAVPNPSDPSGIWDVSGGVVLSLKVACGAIDGCGVDASFDNVTFTIN